MKVGIISINKYSKHLNFGAALHSYAFQQYLDKQGIDNVSWIEETLPFVPVSIEEDLPESLRGKTGKEGYLQVLPGNGSDGFFVAKFQRKGI